LDLAAIWVTLTATFAYLEVPLVNAPLFATALVLQAALGTVVITRLLKGAQPSLLMLLGPGLILGGALSFAIFQLTGRGVLGLGIAGATAVIATALLTRPESEPAATVPRLEVVVQLLGLSALGLASEFEWLLIPSLGCLLGGLLLALSHRRAASSRTAAIVIVLGSSAFATMFRGSWWWVVTDDYNFFEVLSRHLTKSGPLAEWGVLDVSRYHWLSYGWSGLLDYSAGSPEPLVTLTRVMPFVYALALSASLLALVRLLCGTHRSIPLAVLPIWTLLANFRLDWAATSTAGVYAVLASLIYLLAITSSGHIVLWRRLVLYAMSLLVLCLTKLPSVLSAFPLMIGLETLLFFRGRFRGSTDIRRATIGVFTGILLSISTLPILSAILGDFSVEAKRLPGLLWFYGPLASLATVIVRNIWLGVWLVVSWIVVIEGSSRQMFHSGHRLLLTLTPMVVSGIAMESLVAGPFNVHDYFSGPSYFLAGLVILSTSPLAALDRRLRDLSPTFKFWAVGLLVIALWTSLLRNLTLPSILGRASFSNALVDWRTLTGLLFIVFVALRRRLHNVNRQTSLIVLLSVCFIAGVGSQVRSLIDDGFKPKVQSSELDTMLGPPESRKIGDWLQENTEADSLVATNSLYRDAEYKLFGDDYSLAVWSKREFLVLGPKFFGVSETATREIQLCKRFASSPSAADAQLLGELGVSWFVVDRASTSEQSWEPYGEVVFRAGRFWVIKLASASA
jgi:hypothetical protein